MKISKKIKLKIRDFKIGMRNLQLWFPVIYKDRNWDHHYLYEIIYHKLFLMEMRQSGPDSCIENGIEIADEIREVRMLLKNVIKDKYIDKDNSFELERNDVKKAFEIIGEKSQGWWD
ncbi:hypothetical protein BSK59_13660 [Paenibacillus odorifer]|uniref:hypothetical protein n=1 Tax=Paenibacillus odorifer TaxID=189426 RepID=UPI00096BD1FB|nr:hypothetical protein [Paenibacillus odorifer]OME55518.1 hypothetical protein BSK59_13660 [Paenibacillus odorifer]